MSNVPSDPTDETAAQQEAIDVTTRIVEFCVRHDICSASQSLDQPDETTMMVRCKGCLVELVLTTSPRGWAYCWVLWSDKAWRAAAVAAARRRMTADGTTVH